MLQVIPENMFSILNEIVELQTHELVELPGKVPNPNPINLTLALALTLTPTLTPTPTLTQP